MDFTTEELSNAVLDKLFEQKQKNSFCDLTLLVNDKVIKAHRSILASSSPYFDSILKHHKITREQLSVTCNSVEVFDAIVNYMYTGQLRIEHSNVEEFLRLADFFLMTKIIEYCIEFLGTKLGLDNCLFTYYLTQRFKLKQLGNLVENWIDTHLHEICDREEILRLNVQELHEFLKNKVFSVPVRKLLQIITEWCLKDVEKRENDMNRLFLSISWNNLDVNEVYKHLEECTLYSKSELALFYLLHNLFINNLLTANFRDKYDLLHSKYQQTLKQEDKLDNKITVAERDGNNMIIVKARNRNRKEQLLMRLMAGLKPSLRIAAMKAIRKKNKKITLDDYFSDNFEIDSDSDDEKVGVKCPICSANINDSLLLEQHLALSHAKDVTYKCGTCNFVCQYHGDYLNHMKTHFPGPPFKCDFCDFGADQISKLIAHRAKHLEDSVFQCTFCSFKCRSKQNYLAHLKIHAPEKSFKCEHCTKTFKFKHNLDSHLLTHSSEKTLDCDSCGFHTKFLSHMIAHKRIHAGDIYRCSYPHCKYSTSKKNQLVSHAKSHNGLRPHSCTVCGRGFMEKSHLVRHERIHLEEKPFKCSNCDYASSRRDKLKEHFTRHHGENASAKVPYKARPMRNVNGASSTNSRLNNKGLNQEPSTTTTTNSGSSSTNGNINFSTASNANGSNVTTSQSIGTDLQELIMQHQNHTNNSTAGNIASLNTNYHAFTDPTDFHHHTHQIQHQILNSHNQRPGGQHSNNVVNHHMLGRANHSTTTSTAAAVAAAMMLDPRFHHNSTVPYHASTTPVSMAMAAAQTSQQQVQSGGGSAQHSEYSTTLQNCMTLF